MAKVDDTLVIPEVLTAPWVKRFFKNRLGIPDVAVQNAGAVGREWMCVRIRPLPSKSHMDPLRYQHAFTPEFGLRCMGIVYEGHPTLSLQTWGGNIEGHSISMYGGEFRRLLQGLLDLPLGSPLPQGVSREEIACV